jgi:hypothetical protein
MKEYMGNSINISLIKLEDGNYRAQSELIVVVSEPTYTISPAGEMIRQRQMDHFRFSVGTHSLRAFIKSLEEYADEMEATEKRFTTVDDEVAA